LKKPFQERFGVSWDFIDRVYDFAKECMADHKYKDAADIFGLLTFIHPMVLEYWLGKGACLFGQQQYEDSLHQYSFSLCLSPQNPLSHYEIARCYFQLKDRDKCLFYLDRCLQYCEQDRKYDALMSEAGAVKQAIELNKLKI
jgi:tetratricopeptide (TPR) repeat protein